MAGNIIELWECLPCVTGEYQVSTHSAWWLMWTLNAIWWGGSRPLLSISFPSADSRPDVALVGASYITIWNWTDAIIPFGNLPWNTGYQRQTLRCSTHSSLEGISQKNASTIIFLSLLWMNFSKLVWFNFSWLFIIDFLKCCSLYSIYHHRKIQVVVFVYLSTNYHYVRDPDFLTPKKIGKLVTNPKNIIKSVATSSLYVLSF